MTHIQEGVKGVAIFFSLYVIYTVLVIVWG